jgi:hypothetical protein
MRGRPRNQTRPFVVNFKLYLVPGEDDDLIAFFQGCPTNKRAKTVQAALRGGCFVGQAVADVADEEILSAFEERIF